MAVFGHSYITGMYLFYFRGTLIWKNIKIPNVSPLFDPHWKTNGLLNKAAELFVGWVKQENVPHLEIEVLGRYIIYYGRSYNYPNELL